MGDRSAPDIPASRRRARVLLSTATVVLVMLAAEGVLRVAGGGILQDEFLQPDRVLGWSLKPGFSGWYADERALWVQINSQGFRDRERPLARMPDTVRVAVLGDSYVQGVNLPMESTFPSLLETRLATCLSPAGLTAEVLNFGVSGYGTAQELLQYRNVVSAYAPDLVVLAVYTRNDIFNNVRALNPTAFPDQSPYFTLDGDRLVPDEGFLAVLDERGRQPWWRRWRQRVTARSRVAQLAYAAWGGLRDAVGLGLDRGETGPPEGIEDEIYRPPTTPEIAEAWRVTEALVGTLADEVRAGSREFWIVTLFNADQVNPDVAARQALARRLGVDSLFYPDHRLQALAESRGIPFVSLAEPMADFAARTGTYLNGEAGSRAEPGTGHWNGTATLWAADMVGARLCDGSSAVSSAVRP